MKTRTSSAGARALHYNYRFMTLFLLELDFILQKCANSIAHNFRLFIIIISLRWTHCLLLKIVICSWIYVVRMVIYHSYVNVYQRVSLFKVAVYILFRFGGPVLPTRGLSLLLQEPHIPTSRGWMHHIPLQLAPTASKYCLASSTAKSP